VVNLIDELTSLIADWDGSDLGRVCHLANAAALLYHRIPRINWLGFYCTDERGDTLVLGPFQGKVACTTIPFERGVCGLCARTATAIRVDDVTTFSDHIVCDSESRSEVVAPLIDSSGRVVGVLDVDSPEIGRFSEADEALLVEAASVISRYLYS
jgi:L-methionine (R)-S-oxide reductase